MLDWLPIYPARIATAVLLGAAFQPYHAGSQFTIPSVSSWKATYPDRMLRTVLPTAQRPSFFYPANNYPALAVPPLAWKGVQPDRLDRRRLPVADQPAYFSVPFTRNTELREFPLYPAQIARRRMRAADHPWSFFKLEGIPAFLSWAGEQPPFVRPRVGLRAGSQSAYFFHPDPVLDPVPESSSWAPTYVDRVWPRRGLLAGAQRHFAINLDPIPNAPPSTDFNSPPVYPARVLTRSRWPALYLASSPVWQPTAVPGADLRWWHLPVDPIRRVSQRVSELVAPLALAQVSVPDFTLWWPQYPDRLAPRAGSLWLGWMAEGIVPSLSPPTVPDCVMWGDLHLEISSLTAPDFTRSLIVQEDATGPQLSLEATCH